MQSALRRIATESKTRRKQKWSVRAMHRTPESYSSHVVLQLRVRRRGCFRNATNRISSSASRLDCAENFAVNQQNLVPVDMSG